MVRVAFISPVPLCTSIHRSSSIQLPSTVHLIRVRTFTSSRTQCTPSQPCMSAAAPIPTPSSKPSPSPSVTSLRRRIFLTMLLCYSVSYLTRFSFPFSAPLMSLTLPQIGFITSLFPIFYAPSKLLSGTLSDLHSPRIILSLALLLSSIINLLFALSSSFPVFAMLWALNGIVSSLGFPACAKLLSSWYPPDQRATYWGLLNISLNIGGALSPILIPSIATQFGWRAGFLLPACLALVTSLLAYTLISDSPTNSTNDKESPNQSPPNSSRPSPLRMLRTFHTHLFHGVLTQRPVWHLSVAYFFVYIIRQALTSWTVFYLLNARGVASLTDASLRVSGLELGGLLGSISAGWLSDFLVKRSPESGVLGQRVKVIVMYVCIMMMALLMFFSTPVQWRALQWMLFGLVGFGLYGPQLLVGLGATECVEKRYAGTSNGFVGLTAYGGAAMAGLPLTMAVGKFGWSCLVPVVVGCCLAVVAAVAGLWGKKSFEQCDQARKTKSA